MSELGELGEAIRAKLAAVEAQRQSEREAHEQQRLLLAQRLAQFDESARLLAEEIIRPRVEKLAGFFENAEVAQAQGGHRYGPHCLFRRSPEFPATVRLDIQVDCDRQVDNVVLVYHLEILPVFFQFEGHRSVMLPVNDVDQSQVIDWVDERILEFVDVYLQIPRTPQYYGKLARPAPQFAARITPDLRIPSGSNPHSDPPTDSQNGDGRVR